MQVFLFAAGGSSVVESRLDDLDLSSRRWTGDSLQDLNRATANHVYLVPASVTETSDWPQLRVRLAQANRFYVVVGHSMDSARIVGVTRDGAFDVLQVSDSDERWRSALAKVVESQELWVDLYGGSKAPSPEVILGRSPAMKSLRQAIERLGPTVAGVLILGDSGVGKERVANALHASFGKGPFVAVNCAAIPKELMESELFGAEKGAYTGAVRTRAGLVEQASGGTLFLDEIGELDIKLQPKLLRFLETKRARRVGGHAEIHSEVRVISATNSNLEAEIARGTFRSDLYYRLSEVILHIPPLRARPEDIPQLALAFLEAASERMGKLFDTLEPALILKFQAYDWPGNVRELRNAIDRMVILYDGPVLRAAWWDPPAPMVTPVPSRAQEGPVPLTAPPPVASLPTNGMLLNRRQRLELAARLLESSSNDLSWVAAQLGIHPTTLYRWRKSGKV